MSRNLHKVVWTEGMYLAAHHFQAQARFFEERIQFAADCFWRYPFGFCSLDLDREELRNGVLAVTHARGVMPDGFAFDLAEGSMAIDKIDVAAVYPISGEPLTLYLAIPLFEEGQRNTGPEPVVDRRRVRLLQSPTEFADTNSGQDVRSIAVARPNFRIATGRELSQKDVSLPLARVMRDGAGRFVLDPAFIPPCLHMNGSPALEALVEGMVQSLDEKAASLRSLRSGASASQNRGDPKELLEFWMLHAIHAALPGLRHLQRSRGSHPEQIYLTLARLAGSLCTFAIDSEPGALPLYDHDHLGSCLGELASHIRRHLDVLLPVNCFEVPLTRYQQLFYRGSLDDPRWLGEGWWVLGIKASVPETRLIANVPAVLKLSSKDWVERIVRQALPGVPLTYLPHPPPSVPLQPGMAYFSVDRGDRLFLPITQQKTVGVYVPEELANPELHLWVVLGGRA